MRAVVLGCGAALGGATAGLFFLTACFEPFLVFKTDFSLLFSFGGGIVGTLWACWALSILVSVVYRRLTVAWLLATSIAVPGILVAYLVAWDYASSFEGATVGAGAAEVGR